MTEKEARALTPNDEFYLVRGTYKASYHKCVVIRVTLDVYNNGFEISYRLKGGNNQSTKTFRDVYVSDKIFVKKVDMLMFMKRTNKKFTKQMEEELARSLTKDAEYWI